MIILKQNIGSDKLSKEHEKQIRQVLMDDLVIVYPTDTLYGLGVDACSEKAVEQLYHLKARKDSPISVLLESTDQLLSLALNLSNRAQDLIRAFLPGALTVICKSQYPFAKQLISEQGTIGFRVSGDSISRQIPRLMERPITTTSVNTAGLPAANSIAEVLEYFGEQLALMIDVGTLKYSKGSTVIDVTSNPFKILREGEISRQALQDFLN